MFLYFSAVVTLKDASVVDEAISKLNNTELNGLVVSVVKYHSDKILCVAHLPTLLTEYQFRELAAQYGNLEKCFLMRSEETGMAVCSVLSFNPFPNDKF